MEKFKGLKLYNWDKSYIIDACPMCYMCRKDCEKCLWYAKNANMLQEWLTLIASAPTLKAERDELLEGLKDIRARVKEIKYHHTKPRSRRPGNTSSICEDILSRIEQITTAKVEGK